MKINIFNLFRKKNEFQDDFPMAQFSALPRGGLHIRHFYLWKKIIYMLIQHGL